MAQETRAIGAALHLGEQFLPLAPRQPAALEIGARPFPAVVEESLVVVGGLQRHDLRVDELVEPCEVLGGLGATVDGMAAFSYRMTEFSPYAHR